MLLKARSLRADLQEVLQTVQTTLESVRSLSQALHPGHAR